MLQGGFREGDFCVIGALQHRYKTGFSLSLFKHLALYNTPSMRDQNKKPLLLRISFEDDITLNLQFLYQSLKENETGQKTILTNVTEEEMSSYVKERLQGAFAVMQDFFAENKCPRVFCTHRYFQAKRLQCGL
jgi:hypothetical protein